MICCDNIGLPKVLWEQNLLEHSTALAQSKQDLRSG